MRRQRNKKTDSRNEKVPSTRSGKGDMQRGPEFLVVIQREGDIKRFGQLTKFK